MWHGLAPTGIFSCANFRPSNSTSRTAPCARHEGKPQGWWRASQCRNSSTHSLVYGMCDERYGAEASPRKKRGQPIQSPNNNIIMNNDKILPAKTGEIDGEPAYCITLEKAGIYRGKQRYTVNEIPDLSATVSPEVEVALWLLLRGADPAS
jgi:hypothetical protein